MNSSRTDTIIAGTLFIIGTIAGLISVVPAIDAPDYLTQASENASEVQLGALFQFIMSVAFAGFAIVLYPILREHNEKLALGFLSFKIIAAVLNIIGFIILLVLLSISLEFAKSYNPNLSYFQTLGSFLKATRDIVNHVAMIFVSSVGGLMLYTLLFQSKLVPRWLSNWGFLGTILTISASLLVMFNMIEIITTAYIVLNLPMVGIEMVLAIRLITKGFSPTSINSFPTKEM